MKKTFTLSLLIYLVALGISAKEKSDFTGSLLWKVSGKDISRPSYILGSHHLTDIKFLEQIEGFQEAFANCNTIIGELDIRNKAALQKEIEGSIMLGANEKGYKDLLTEEEYVKLDQDLQQFLGAPLAMLETFKPMMLTTMLTMKIYAEIMPSFDPVTHVSIDEHVQIMGTAKNKKVKGLESVQDQIDALYNVSIEGQLEDLLCTFSEMDSMRESIEKLNKFYEEAQLDSLYHLAFDVENDINSACPISKENKHAVLDNRNLQWLEKLPQLLKEDSNLIVVGALHLAGEEGLLYELKQMGYTIEPIGR